MKKVILSLALISAGLFSSYACTAKASSNAASASTETTAAAPSEETAADDKAAEGAIKHIDAAYLRKYIWDYKEEPSKFVFKGSRPAIIDFYADWCGPCRRVAPVLQDLANQFKIDYVCPKCGTFLGEIPWESLAKKKRCPTNGCRAKWVNDNKP